MYNNKYIIIVNNTIIDLIRNLQVYATDETNSYLFLVEIRSENFSFTDCLLGRRLFI